MKIYVGTKNQIKINAVKESITNYSIFCEAIVFEKEVSSDILDQPKSLDETIKGAKNRAYNSYKSDGISFGIEDGLMKVSGTKTGFMNVCVCVIYDGYEYYIGLSSAFESPNSVMDLILVDKLDMSQAYLKAGFTDNPELGKAGGAIGILTKGRLLRKEYTKQAILTALIHLENQI